MEKLKNNYNVWDDIDWKHVNYRVEKMQKRIAEAAVNKKLE